MRNKKLITKNKYELSNNLEILIFYNLLGKGKAVKNDKGTKILWKIWYLLNKRIHQLGYCSDILPFIDHRYDWKGRIFLN